MKKILFLTVCLIGSVFASQQQEHWSSRAQLLLEKPPCAQVALAMFKDAAGKKILESSAQGFWKKGFLSSRTQLGDLLYGLAAAPEADQENAGQLLSMYLKAKKSTDYPADNELHFAWLLHGTAEALNLPCMKVLLDEAGVSHNLAIAQNDELRGLCVCQVSLGKNIYPLRVVARKNETPASVRMFEFLCERGARFGPHELASPREHDIHDSWTTRYNAFLKSRHDKAVAVLREKLLKDEPMFTGPK